MPRADKDGKKTGRKKRDAGALSEPKAEATTAAATAPPAQRIKQEAAPVLAGGNDPEGLGPVNDLNGVQDMFICEVLKLRE